MCRCRDFVRAPKTVLDVFDMGTNHADLVHVVYQDERDTFGQVRQRALSMARELQDTFGVRAGDRVAICMRNLPEYPVAVWAAALCGAIVTPMNSWWVGAELAYAIDNAGARVVVLDHERVDRLLDHGRPEGVTVIGVRGAAGDVAFEDLVGGATIEADRIVRLGRDDIIAMLFTSGTTGHPKGALLTNRGMMANVWNMAFGNAREALISGRPPAPARQPASLSVGPLFHIGGMTAIFSSPMGGAKLVFMHKWELEESLRLAREENITQFGGVPTMVRQVLDRKGVGGLGLAIQGFPMGGAAVPPDLPLRAVDEFGAGIQLLNGYGLTRDHVCGGDQRRHRVPRSPDERRAAEPDRRPEDRRPRRRGGRHRRGRRDLLPLPPGGEGVLEQPGGERGRLRRRLVPQRGPRLRRRRAAICTSSTGSRTW